MEVSDQGRVEPLESLIPARAGLNYLNYRFWWGLSGQQHIQALFVNFQFIESFTVTITPLIPALPQHSSYLTTFLPLHFHSHNIEPLSTSLRTTAEARKTLEKSVCPSRLFTDSH